MSIILFTKISLKKLLVDLVLCLSRMERLLLPEPIITIATVLPELQLVSQRPVRLYLWYSTDVKSHSLVVVVWKKLHRSCLKQDVCRQ